MNVRRGRTPLLPISLRQTTEERGQIASTIWAEESGEGLLSEGTYFRISYFGLPTRLSTKVTFRSHCRTKEGGHPVRVLAPIEVLRGCCLCSEGAGTSADVLCFGQYVVMERGCSQTLLVVVKEG
jgi:hypothetical protein